MEWLQYIGIVLVLIIITLVIIKLQKKDFSSEVNKLVKYLGGKDNIINAECNMSSFKVILKDVRLVDKARTQKLGPKGIVEIDNELKIILGPNSKQLKKYMTDLK